MPAGERRRLAALVHHNLLFPQDARHWVDVLHGDLPPLAEAERAVLAEAGAGFFAEALDALGVSGPDLGALARELKRRTGRKGAGLFMPLRVALTGRRDGPELGPLLAALPEGTLRARLQAAAAADQGQDRC